jgi:hypothetical protein
MPTQRQWCHGNGEMKKMGCSKSHEVCILTLQIILVQDNKTAIIFLCVKVGGITSLMHIILFGQDC